MYYKMQPIIVNILQTIWNDSCGLLQNIFFYVTIILTKQQASYIKKGFLKKLIFGRRQPDLERVGIKWLN